MNLNRVCTTDPPLTTSKSADFTLYKGTTFRPTFKFKQSDGTPLPISGKIITFYIVDSDGNSILTVNSSSVTPNGSTILITDDPNGIVDILITDEETSLLSFTSGNWWVTLTYLSGDVFLRGRGNIYLKEPYE